MDTIVTTLAQRPDLAPHLADFPGAWPEFAFHDPIAMHLYQHLTGADPRYTLVAVDAAAPDLPIAKCHTLPVSWRPDQLPDSGFDGVLLTAAADAAAGTPARMVCAVEITVQCHRRGEGISATVLAAARRNTVELGFTDLAAPVRPNHKHLHPEVPMAEYLTWTREDGLPADPWLRTHLRAGARVVRPARTSMTITGSLADWRAWTGLPFDTTGPVLVPGALTPVGCHVDHDVAVYVEPNVWVHHRL